MKIVLLFSYSAALVFCVTGEFLSWPLRALLGAVASLALLHELSRSAPVGYQGNDGFHYSHMSEMWPNPRKNSLREALSPLKA